MSSKNDDVPREEEEKEEKEEEDQDDKTAREKEVPSWVTEAERVFRDDVFNEGDAMYQTLKSMPKDLISQATEKGREAGKEAFKSKKFSQAKELFDQSSVGARVLGRLGDLAKDLSNRSACHLALGDPEAALRDAGACLAADRAFNKGWFRAGRALFEMERYGEAETAFGGGLMRDPDSREIERWYLKAKGKAAQVAKAKASDNLKSKRFEIDYSKFDAVKEEDSDDEEANNTNLTGRGLGGELTAEDLGLDLGGLDLEGSGLRIEAPPETMAPLTFENTMIFRAEAAVKAAEPRLLRALASNLRLATAVGRPRQVWATITSPAVQLFSESVYRQLCRPRPAPVLPASAPEPPHWLFLGLGSCLPLMTYTETGSGALRQPQVGQAGQAGQAGKVGGRAPERRLATALVFPSPFLDRMAVDLLSTNERRRSEERQRRGVQEEEDEEEEVKCEVVFVRRPVENVFIEGEEPPSSQPSDQGGEEEQQPHANDGRLQSRADVVVIDPEILDEGMLGLRVLPMLRHVKQHLASPKATILPSRGRIFALPAAIITDGKFKKNVT